ncbi:MAG: alpha-L-fucosidase, partial [Candidatus Methylumidiphilus sp.]
MSSNFLTMKRILSLLVLITLWFSGTGQTPTNNKQKLEEWKDARFGMFIHWGPVALKGTEIGWSRGREIPVEEYDNLYKKFDAPNFDANSWVSVAKAAGMKYIILTTKHHDGFCLWNTRQSDFNIMNSPLHRDVVKELAEACKKQGIKPIIGCSFDFATLFAKNKDGWYELIEMVSSLDENGKSPEQYDNTNVSKNIGSIMEHKYVRVALYFFLVLYASLAAPSLPQEATKLFNNDIFRILVFFVIAYYGSNGDVGIAILIAVGYIISIITINKYSTNKSILTLMNIH